MAENEIDCEGGSVVATHIRIRYGFRFRERRAGGNRIVQQIVQAEINLFHCFQYLQLRCRNQDNHVLAVGRVDEIVYRD